MKIAIDIPEKTLREAMKYTRANTERDAVVAAVEEFNRRRRLEKLADRLQGSCPNFMTQSDLERMRNNWKCKPI